MIFKSFLKQKNKFFYAKLNTGNTDPVLRWNHVSIKPLLHSLYRITVDNKVSDLSWKIIHSGLTTAVKLYKWRVIPDSFCRSCNRRAVENTQHLFWLCPVAKQLWAFVTNLARQLGYNEPLSYVGVVTIAPQQNTSSILLFHLISMAKYSLWKYRNAYFYDDEVKPDDITKYFVQNVAAYIRRDFEVLNAKNGSRQTLLWAHNGILCRVVGPKLCIKIKAP